MTVCPLCQSNTQRSLGLRSFYGPLEGYQPFLQVDVATFDREILLCQACGLRHVHPMYGAVEFEALYAQDGYRVFQECVQTFPSREMLEAWKKQFVDLRVTELRGRGGPPRFLDVGCGLGRNMLVMRELGFDVLGIDLNAAEVEHVVTQLKMPAETVGLQAFAQRGQRFECVLAAHVIEHVDDPRRFVEQLACCLSDDGMLILETPLRNDYRQMSERYRDIYHTLFFDHHTLALLGGTCGLGLAGCNNLLFHHADTVNLYMQVAYRRAVLPDAQALSRVAEALRPAYDMLLGDAMTWVDAQLLLDDPQRGACNLYYKRDGWLEHSSALRAFERARRQAGRVRRLARRLLGSGSKS